jgi:hypothetical protein
MAGGALCTGGLAHSGRHGDGNRAMRRDLRGVLERMFFLARNTWRPSSSP